MIIRPSPREKPPMRSPQLVALCSPVALLVAALGLAPGAASARDASKAADAGKAARASDAAPAAEAPPAAATPAAEPPGGPKVTIMAFGDSLTKGTGSTHGAGYRLEFLHRMSAAGVDVDMLGSYHSGPNDIDRDHEGHQGE